MHRLSAQFDVHGFFHVVSLVIFHFMEGSSEYRNNNEKKPNQNESVSDICDFRYIICLCRDECIIVLYAY